jgi:beta-glucanase (GH16 family)
MDIMEHLTRWGPHRYNIANHWDGYGKDHISCGSTMNYVPADKDGFITCGLLWTPGVVAYYGNGKELVRMESPRVSTVPCFFIFEVTTGGWENNSVDDTKFPVDYVIDYVRCWQRKDLASDADGPKVRWEGLELRGRRARTDEASSGGDFGIAKCSVICRNHCLGMDILAALKT